MSTDFDDISELIQDVLDDKPVSTPEPELQEPVIGAVVAPVPADDIEAEEQMESTAFSDDDILGDFINEALSPPAQEPAESVSVEVPDGIDAIENVMEELTGDTMSGEAETPLAETREVEASEPGLTTEEIETGLELESDLTQCVTSEHVFAEPVEKAQLPLPTFTTEEIADSLDIRNFATLVTLNTARWHAKVKDRKAAKDAADAAGATPEAFEARKLLLAGCDSELKAVHKEIDNARTEHYRLTLPWSSVGVNDIGKRSGGRLMPNTLFLEYTTAMAKAKAAMEAKLAIFVKKYPSLLAVVQQKLGSAFDPAQYPNPSSIAAHFNLSFDFNPIPLGEDFKGLQQGQVDKLRSALNRKTRGMLENALQDAWKKLHETVQHVHATLANPDKMFHASLIENLRKQADLLGHLNATMDVRIAQVANLIGGDLIKFDPKDIRKDPALRKRLAETAGAIVKYMEESANETL